MIRKAFIHVGSLLHSSNKNDIKKLKSTIKFLTKGDNSSSTLNKLIQNGITISGNTDDESSYHNTKKPSNNNKSSLLKTKPTAQEQEYINTILKILNSTLPSKETHIQRVDTHYQVFFNQLQKVLNQFENYSDRTRSKYKNNHNNDRYPHFSISLQDDVNYKTMNSNDLYNRLILLQLVGQLTLRDTTQIILSKNYNLYAKTFQNLSIFSKIDQLNITVLLYYKLKSSKNSSTPDVNNSDDNDNSLIHKIWDQYSSLWIKDFDNLHHSIKRIFWRCIYMTDPSLINDILQFKLKQWDMNNLVVLYQSLFQHVYKLNLSSTITNDLLINNNFKNQELFIKVINLLSPHKTLYLRTMIEIVKLSIQVHLNEVRQENSPEKVGSQLMFATSLSLILKKIYGKINNNQNVDSIKLKQELEQIFNMIDEQESDLKEKISLKFI